MCGPTSAYIQIHREHVGVFPCLLTSLAVTWAIQPNDFITDCVLLLCLIDHRLNWVTLYTGKSG